LTDSDRFIDAIGEESFGELRDAVNVTRSVFATIKSNLGILYEKNTAETLLKKGILAGSDTIFNYV